jgi:hypothetical protein
MGAVIFASSWPTWVWILSIFAHMLGIAVKHPRYYFPLRNASELCLQPRVGHVTEAKMVKMLPPPQALVSALAKFGFKDMKAPMRRRRAFLPNPPNARHHKTISTSPSFARQLLRIHGMYR